MTIECDRRGSLSGPLNMSTANLSLNSRLHATRIRPERERAQTTDLKLGFVMSRAPLRFRLPPIMLVRRQSSGRPSSPAVAVVDRFIDGSTHYVVVKRSAPEVAPFRALKGSERATLHYVACGAANKYIAYELGISESTVSTTLKRIRQKLNAPSPADLVHLLWVLRPAAQQNSVTNVAYLWIDAEQYAAFIRTEPEGPMPSGLARRELLVFHALLAGRSSQRIATSHDVSPRTVANQIASIYRKLGIGSRAELRAQYTHCYASCQNNN